MFYNVHNENNDSHQTSTTHEFSVENFITIMIVIIFCLIFIIFLTIFDFYKKPSIYELELLNEFKSSNCNKTQNNHKPCNDSSEHNNTSNDDENKKNKRLILIYQDILYLLFYIIILYLISLTYLPEPLIGFIAILLIFCLLKIKKRN